MAISKTEAKTMLSDLRTKWGEFTIEWNTIVQTLTDEKESLQEKIR